MSRPGGVAWVLAVLVVLPWQEGSAQRRLPSPDLGVRWWSSDTVSPLRIRGVVLDADTGNRLSAAQVYLRDTSIGALSNGSGDFSLVAPGPGTYELVAELIGYRRMSAELEVGSDEGLQVQVTTVQQPLPICGLIVCPYPGCGAGVAVEVRDADTGVAPLEEVTLTVVADGRAASATGVAPARDSAYLSSRRPVAGFEVAFDSAVAASPIKLFAGGTLGTESPFDVSVSSDGYHTWVAEGVRILPRDCMPDMSEVLKVWLQPRR